MLKYLDENLYIEYLMDKLSKNRYSNLILKHNGYQLDDFDGNSENIYILKSGIVKHSILNEDGNEINIKFQNNPGIVNLFINDKNEIENSSHLVTVKSYQAWFYKINIKNFNKIVNDNYRLKKYIDIHHENELRTFINILEYGMTYSKLGSVCAFFSQCSEQSGIKIILRDGTKVILINLELLHDDIGKFCGINNRSSVSRIIAKLKKMNILDSFHHYYIIKDLDKLNMLKLK